MNINDNINFNINDELILPVNSIEQSYKWDCGPTSLRIILQYQFNLKLTARECIFLTAATEEGCDEYNFRRALDLMGFKYSQTTNGTFNQLKSSLQNGILPLIHVVVSDGVGHYMVFCGYNDTDVWLADPATGTIVKYGISYFMGIWKIEEKETQTRWFLLVTEITDDKFDSEIKKLKKLQKKVQLSRK